MDGEADASTVASEVQSCLWQSVVRVTSGTNSGTALVKHRSSRYLNSLTNLHFWLAEFEDEEEVFLSADFKVHAMYYLEMKKLSEDEVFSVVKALMVLEFYAVFNCYWIQHT
ncbi:hypothetical protein P3T76_002728 [Phytophthora citrophthora]|uniref:Uncharacterized protein n=1 Tax=Phytophthora citrophthora TaxID=4793 RepID=A0AAD9LQA6_9STRA|nr:hypothetical protein P3T76_002728 [Phytophthora citrophthora]